MRGELSGIWLWLVLVFVAGAVVGRLVIPLFEPHGSYLVEIGNDPGKSQCTLSVGGTEGNILETGHLDYYHGMKCRERKAFGNTVIQCRCDGD